MHRINRHWQPLPQKMQGVTLIIGLIMLLLLTIIGTTAMQVSSVQHKMSGGIRDINVAFQASEAGLVNGEDWLGAQTSEPLTAASCTQPCVVTHDNTLYYEDQGESWWQTNAMQVSSGTISNVASQPYYHIQYLKYIPDNLTIGHGTGTGKHYYAVTSFGTGGRAETVSVLQTTYSRRY